MVSIKLYDNKIILSNYTIIDNFVKEKNSCKRDYINESVSRAKRKIYDFGICNDWTHFLTITFNSKKINRFDLLEVKNKFLKYLRNYTRIDSDFKYLVVPELHKNGALHFHGLVRFGLNSRIYLKKFKSNIFNHDLFTKIFGFNRFIEIIEKSNAIITYIVKYVSKEVNKIFRNYYFHSKNLNEPLKIQITNEFEIEKITKKIEPYFLSEQQGLYFYQNSFVSSFVIDNTHELYAYYYTLFN